MNKAAAKTGKQTAKINKSENYVTRCNSSKHNQERGGGGKQGKVKHKVNLQKL